MTLSENFALAALLSDWPQEKTYEEVLQMVQEDHEDILIWQPLESCELSWVIEQIDIVRINAANLISLSGGIDKED